MCSYYLWCRKKIIIVFKGVSFITLLRGPSWSWSYGSWINSYLCNRCLSPLTLWVWIPLRRGVPVLETPKIFSSHLDNLNQNLGCPKNCLVVQSNPQSGLVHLACEVVLTVGGPLKAPRSSGVNGAKSCILGISWHINLSFQIGFFYWNFCLTSHKAHRSSGLKGAKICNLAISAVFYGARTPFGNLFLDFLVGGSFAPVTNFHMFEKLKLIKIRLITGNGIGIRFRSNINNAKVPMIV